MQSEGGYELKGMPPIPPVTLDEAKALVDAWGDIEKDGIMSFKIHRVAIVLRREVARLEARQDELLKANSALVEKCRAAVNTQPVVKSGR